MTALIWCPFADEASARKAAATLLDEGLAACANIVPAMQSIFVWEGEQGEAGECGALFKTHGTLLDRAVERLEAIHPYDCPAIMGWRVDVPGRAAGAWLQDLVKEQMP